MSEQTKDNNRSIADLSRMLRGIIERETAGKRFWVAGEIQRFHQSDLGHCYFNLDDGESQIRCMLHDKQRGDIPFDLENRLRVRVYGDIQFYDKKAEVQISIKKMRLAHAADYEAPAIDRLREAGLYPREKRQPPARIRRIGCVTGRSSRAIGDFENAYRDAGERGSLPPHEWRYVLLEGERAVQDIVDSIADFDANPDIDAIAIMRGGGRKGDFAAFDSFAVAEAICRCETFVVTGIGHHRDQTLADNVADQSAATPTAAANYLANRILDEAARASEPPMQPPEPLPPPIEYPEPQFEDYPPEYADAPPYEPPPQPYAPHRRRVNGQPRRRSRPAPRAQPQPRRQTSRLTIALLALVILLAVIVALLPILFQRGL